MRHSECRHLGSGPSPVANYSMQTIMTDPLWYSPLNVVAHHEADFRETVPPEKVEEMMTVAIAVTGIQEAHKKQYWVQGVSDSEQSPDVRTICADTKIAVGKAPYYQQQDVEVVEYTTYSARMNLAEFVASTKLSKEKAYDDLTTILVNVQGASRLPSQSEWERVLGATGKKNPVLVLGLISASEPLYRLAVVHPVVEVAIDYNAIDLMKKHGSGGVMHFRLGTKAENKKVLDEKHCPFESFGIRCNLL
jgi:hypothetical protein